MTLKHRLATLEEKSGAGFLPFALAMPGQTDEQARDAAGYAADAANPILQIQFGRWPE